MQAELQAKLAEQAECEAQLARCAGHSSLPAHILLLPSTSQRHTLVAAPTPPSLSRPRCGVAIATAEARLAASAKQLQGKQDALQRAEASAAKRAASLDEKRACCAAVATEAAAKLQELESWVEAAAAAADDVGAEVARQQAATSVEGQGNM